MMSPELMERLCGNKPSSRPAMNTTGNSRPLALCMVSSETGARSSTESASDTSAACGEDTGRQHPCCRGPPRERMRERVLLEWRYGCAPDARRVRRDEG